MSHAKLMVAAGYIRMSGRQQEKSPAEQRAEIAKLASREGCQVVEWFTDEAITGDSGTDARPGLAALLAGAKAGSFKMVLAWHTNRVSRENPMDAIGFYNQLRKAGVRLHTCCEGAIDLEDFAKQLLLFINQKASNDYLLELSAKSLRGRIAVAKTGCHNGGRAIFAMDRGLFDPAGKLVRRLQLGERAHLPGHQIRLLPCTDQGKIDAVKYAFNRFDTADLSRRQLARELEAKGFPAPGGGWNLCSVTRVLQNRAYAGTSLWGTTASGKYHEMQGGDIVVSARSSKRRVQRKKLVPDAIRVESAHQGIVSVALFNRVQTKLPRPRGFQRKRRAEYPLSGLIYCGHCGQPMYGAATRVKVKGRRYEYMQYTCSTYSNHNGPTSACGRNPVDAALVLGWLTKKLQEVYLGPGRDALVQEVKKQLKAEPKANRRDSARLEKRSADLEKEVKRLVKAIRTLDAEELVEELSLVQAEREQVKAQLAETGKLTDAADLDAEAERIADQVWTIGQRLGHSDPAIVRDVLQQFVYRITCRWETTDRRKRRRCHLIGGTVELWPQTPFSSPSSVLGAVAQSSTRLPF
jgi:DNA invertase Pin-like site-specific DNA recombinase